MICQINVDLGTERGTSHVDESVSVDIFADLYIFQHL